MKQNYHQDPAKYIGDIRYKDFYHEYYKRIKLQNIKSVTELGMGSGDFLYHLPDNIRGIGIDTSEVLVQTALKTRKKENLSFIKHNILQDKVYEKTDLVVMTGFMCTFLDFKIAIDCALKIAKKSIFINDFINNHGVDCKYSFRINNGQFQTVYNIWSKETLEEYFNKLKLKYEIQPYYLQTHLIPGKTPLENFHVNIDGNKTLINNGGIILHGCNIYLYL